MSVSFTPESNLNPAPNLSVRRGMPIINSFEHRRNGRILSEPVAFL